MHKIIYIFIIKLFFISSILFAREPFVAILTDVISNNTQKFNIGNFHFYCEPYGIITVDKLYEVSAKGSRCRKTIKSFYIKNPDLKYFVNNLLKLRQTYHIESKKNRCIIYSFGQKTLSESLLRKGLAFLKINFNDDEFSYKYHKAQDIAKRYKEGIHNSKIAVDCISEIDK